MRGTLVIEVEFHVLVYPTNADIGSFLGGLFRKILSYLNKGARAVGKEALRAELNEKTSKIINR